MDAIVSKEECEFCGGVGCAVCGAGAARVVGLDGGRGGGEDAIMQQGQANEASASDKKRAALIAKAQAGLKELIGAIWTTLDDEQNPEEYDLVGEIFNNLLEDLAVFRSLGEGNRKRSRSNPEVPTWEPQADLFDSEKAEQCFAEYE